MGMGVLIKGFTRETNLQSPLKGKRVLGGITAGSLL